MMKETVGAMRYLIMIVVTVTTAVTSSAQNDQRYHVTVPINYVTDANEERLWKWSETPLLVLMTSAEAERFRKGVHEGATAVKAKGGVLYINGHKRALDLYGTTVADALARLKKNRHAAASLRVATPVLCDERILGALNALKMKRMSITTGYGSRCLTKLKVPELYLALDKPDDDSLAGLVGLSQIRVLKFVCHEGCNNVTDAGFEHLHSMSRLRLLDWSYTSTRITKKGLARLKKALPGLTIKGLVIPE
jgi:hypothetical protein